MKHYKLLSDAMLDGAKLNEQTFEAYADSKGNTCAMGAMREAITGDPYESPRLTREQGSLLISEVCCPGECPEENTAFGIIIHLNDEHKWTREQIAAWLSTIEAKLGMVEIVTDEVKSGVSVGARCEANRALSIAGN